MASLAHLLIRTLCVLLIAVFGTVTSFAAPGDWTRISYPVEAQGLSAQPVNLTNTARAPPTVSANVMITGAALAQTGKLRALGGAETTGTVYALLRSSIAPNTGVTHASGVSLPKSQTQMIKEFDLAGYPNKTVISRTSGKNVGTEYTLPDGSRVRVMQADARSPKRASFQNANGQPIDPTTGKPPQPPSGLTRAERKQYVREKAHIVQDD